MYRKPWISASVAVVAVIATAWPVTGHTETLDIPELGVQVPNVPSGTSKPTVLAHVDGYSASLRIGTASLLIARVQEPVPAGSDIRDAGFRTQVSFNDYLGPKFHSDATYINGHPAWTNSSARRSGPGPVHWSCVTYVIVDQHLYHFSASADGGDKPPADFTAAVQAMSDTTFIPVVAPSNATPSGLLRMPASRFKNDMDYYPASAKRRGEGGVVDLEYSIDSKGRAQDVRQLYSTSDVFYKSAMELLQRSSFDIGPNWAAMGYDKVRFTVEVAFAISESFPCKDPPPARIPGGEQIYVCGGKLR